MFGLRFWGISALYAAGAALLIRNPLRPFLGLAAIVLMSVTLSMRVRVLRRGCPVRLKKEDQRSTREKEHGFSSLPG